MALFVPATQTIWFSLLARQDVQYQTSMQLPEPVHWACQGCKCSIKAVWAMAYGHSSRLPPLEAPVMIALKRELFFFSFLLIKAAVIKWHATYK